MSDPILAFNTHEARALTGVSLRRLQYWDETDFIRPSVAARRGRGSPRLYGFRDLIALRVAARLRDQLSLQALRKLKEALDVDAPFASVRFALLPGGDVVYLGPTGHLEAARRPGQITMSFDIPLEEIRADLRAGVDALRERSGVGGIERRRGVLAGQPAVAGTRITPAAIRRMVEDGWSVDRILEESPDLRPEDVAVALARAPTLRVVGHPDRKVPTPVGQGSTADGPSSATTNGSGSSRVRVDRTDSSIRLS